MPTGSGVGAGHPFERGEGIQHARVSEWRHLGEDDPGQIAVGIDPVIAIEDASPVEAARGAPRRAGFGVDEVAAQRPAAALARQRIEGRGKARDRGGHLACRKVRRQGVLTRESC